MEQKIEQILNDLYAYNGRKIHQICDKSIRKFGNLSQKDYDDFYSAANEACAIAITTYDEEKGCLEGYLYRTIQFAIIDEIKKRNRYKRQADRMCTSMDAPVGDGEGCILGDMIADSFDLEQEVFGEDTTLSSFKVKQYLNGLSKRQRKIIELLIASYDAVEVQAELHITQKEYKDAMLVIRSYERVKILF